MHVTAWKYDRTSQGSDCEVWINQGGNTEIEVFVLQARMGAFLFSSEQSNTQAMKR